LALVLIIFIVAGSVGVVLVLSKKSSAQPPIEQTISIVNGVTIVTAGTYVDYSFIVPPNSSSIHVLGMFTVKGGSGGVLVYIFDSTNFYNYENDSYFGALYQSSPVTEASISSNLDSNGTYFLVLDNKASTITQTVNIQANVTYFIS
jgi:hypothetical protein